MRAAEIREMRARKRGMMRRMVIVGVGFGGWRVEGLE